MGYLNVSCEAEAAAASLARGRELCFGQSRHGYVAPTNIGEYPAAVQLSLRISKPTRETFRRCYPRRYLRKHNDDWLSGINLEIVCLRINWKHYFALSFVHTCSGSLQNIPKQVSTWWQISPAARLLNRLIRSIKIYLPQCGTRDHSQNRYWVNQKGHRLQGRFRATFYK